MTKKQAKAILALEKALILCKEANVALLATDNDLGWVDHTWALEWATKKGQSIDQFTLVDQLREAKEEEKGGDINLGKVYLQSGGA